MALVATGNVSRFLFEIVGVSSEFLVIDFSSRERISVPYEVELSLACEDEVAFDDVMGKEAVLTVLGDDRERFIHGVLKRFVHSEKSGRFHVYKATVVPQLWLLSLERDCRIFQNKSVTDIVKTVLEEGGIRGNRFAVRLQGTYAPREYCVQYRETDLDFVSRLLEEEGIFYFFEHEKEKHVLILADSASAYKPVPGNADIPFIPSEGKVPEKECVYEASLARIVRSGKYLQRDYNFEKPALSLESKAEDKDFPHLEIYEYPGRYVDQGRGDQLSKVRLQEAVTFTDCVDGKSTCVRLLPGFTFKIVEHKDDIFNAEYLLVAVAQSGAQPQVLQETASGGGTEYSSGFHGVPSKVVFRPERRTRKPLVQGPQTAMVTGPKGEEIYTDKYGRVKVRFHWDRLGKHDENSSCWVRVASFFAGGQYGAIFTPRVGQEVVIDFLEGDPDQPFVAGRVYNADNMPPYDLPKEMTKSTIKTNSSKGGKGFNEIRFEDLKDNEQFFVHAQKDLDVRILNDRKEWVGQDRHLMVVRDKIEKVDRDSHALVGREERLEVAKDRHRKVGGNEAIEVVGSRSLKVQGDVIETVQGNHSEQVTGDYSAKAMKVVIEGMTGLTIKVGGNFITIDGTGVSIKGAMVMINSGGSAIAASPPSPVPPIAPIVALEADKAVEGKDVTYSAAETHSETSEEAQEEKSWIEIKLVDENNDPVPGERYRVETPDGKISEGTLDQNGFARVNHIKPGTCKVTFPKLDKDAWEKA